MCTMCTILVNLSVEERLVYLVYHVYPSWPTYLWRSDSCTMCTLCTMCTMLVNLSVEERLVYLVYHVYHSGQLSSGSTICTILAGVFSEGETRVPCNLFRTNKMIVLAHQ